MADDVEFNDYTIEVTDAFHIQIMAALYEVSGELVTAVKRNSRRDTGQTRNSFRYKIKHDEREGAYKAFIGSDYQNAIWEEFGTGEFALNGDGRKGGWVYPAEKGTFAQKMMGKKPTKFIFTRGKRPSRAFWNAYTSKKYSIIRRLENAMKGL